MKAILSAVTAYLLLASTLVSARPVDREGPPELFLSAVSHEGGDAPAGGGGIHGAAQAGTTYYGGTVWAADSSRWEAIRDSVWTFDSGVGSHYDYGAWGVNPHKYGAPANPAPPGSGLHALMEGWVGIDDTYRGVSSFRLVTEADFDGGPDTCVGEVAGLGGDWSWWAGVFQPEAETRCYAGGLGYGNAWNMCVGREFVYDGSGTVHWEYDYVLDAEPGWDYAYAMVDTSAHGTDVVVGVYTGALAPASADHALVPGASLRSDPGPVVLKLCAFSDGAYSDEDGLYVTDCGLFAFDDVTVTGGGIGYAADFEGGDAGGWALMPATAGPGGDWSDLAAVASLPPVLTTCGCDLVDSVLVFEDKSVGGHGLYQDNLAASPWIDLLADGLNGTPGKIVQFDGYFDLPLTNYIFVQTQVQWYPAVCLKTGKLYTHPFASDGFVRYFGGIPICRQAAQGSPVRIDFSAVMDPGAEQMRIALGVINYCRYYGNCSGVTNSTPWFDRARLGVYGNPGAPYISARETELPQDSWPANGTLRLDATGRVDCNLVKGDYEPSPGTALGDTLVVQGALGGAEVWMEFFVRPGPGVDSLDFVAWYESHPNGVLRHGPSGPEQWKVARLDTAEVGGVPTVGSWMTAYHEADPSGNFSGNDRDLDPAEGYSHPGALLNDIFPDDLLTAGSRVNLFYRTRQGAGGAWFLLPDTTGGVFYEMEIMPSSMEAAPPYFQTGIGNCLLYVDHADGYGAQPVIEAGLDSVLAQGSNNYENSWWDRFDVRASSGHQSSLGRPLSCDYGASVTQLWIYRVILWNSGSLSASSLSQEDADVLIPWLSIVEPGFGYRHFYASGDGLAESIQGEASWRPAPLRLMNEFCGATFVCGRVGDAGCEPGSPAKPDTCIDLEPVAGSHLEPLETLRTVLHQGQGNGCPNLRSFGLLGVHSGGVGTPLGDEDYGAPSVPWTSSSASVANTIGGGPDYRTVWDGVSLHLRRDPSDCRFAPGRSVEPAVYERLREVLSWFGYADPHELCAEPSGGAVDDRPGDPAPYRTALANFAPNPLVGGARGSIQFTLARQGRASVEIFDVGGRLVRTVFDGIAPEGISTLHWSGSDDAGRAVAAGVYFCRLQALGREFARKLVVIRD